jgi:hypothetical protein
VFAGYSGAPFSNRAFTFGCVPHAEPSGWGRSPSTDSGTLRQQFCSTMWERICGKSRNCSATKLFAPPCATPTSAMSRHGRRRRRLAKLWSRAKKRKCLPLPHRRARQKKDKNDNKRICLLYHPRQCTLQCDHHETLTLPRMVGYAASHRAAKNPDVLCPVLLVQLA